MRDAHDRGRPVRRLAVLLALGLVAGGATATANTLRGASIPAWRALPLAPRGAQPSAMALNERGQVVWVSGTRVLLRANGRVRTIGSLGAVRVSAVDINDRGEVVYTRGRQLRSGYVSRRAFLWRNGKTTDLGILGRDLGGDLPSGSDAVAISERGAVLANSSVEQNAPVSWAFVWQDGRRTALTRPPTRRYSVGMAINDRGQVAGRIGSNIGFGVTRAFLWHRGRFSLVGPLGGRRYGAARALNDGGVLVGEAYSLEADRTVRVRAFRWQGGRITDLGRLPGTTQSSAGALNDRGDIVGTSYDDGGTARAFLWRSGRIIDLGPYDPIAVNARGAVLLQPRDKTEPPTVWRSGRLTRLPTLGGRENAALALNNRGHVVGWSRTRGGGIRAVLWVPRNR
jgi:probable HAF family extracellular repeat protein